MFFYLTLQEAGYEVQYDREAPVELKVVSQTKMSKDDECRLEAIRVRVFTLVSVFSYRKS